MLYRRVNGSFVDANDSHEVIKVCNASIAALTWNADPPSEVYQRHAQGQVWAGYDI